MAQHLIRWMIFGAMLLASLMVLVGAQDAFGQNNGAFNPNIQPTFMNASGSAPAASGFVCTYAAGSDVTLRATYQDNALTSVNQNPIRLNAAGRPVNGVTEVSIYLQPLAYRMKIYAAGTGNTCNSVTVGTLIRSIDNVYDFGQLLAAGIIGFNPALGYQTVTFSATPTFDSSLYSLFAMTLTADVTSSTISNAVLGRLVVFRICQDGTGGRSFAWPAAVLNPPLVNRNASVCTDASFFYNGSNWVSWGPQGNQLLTGGLEVTGTIGAGSVFRTDAGVEVRSSVQPLFSAFNNKTGPPAIYPTEEAGAVTFGSYLSSGTAQQMGSFFCYPFDTSAAFYSGCGLHTDAATGAITEDFIFSWANRGTTMYPPTRAVSNAPGITNSLLIYNGNLKLSSTPAATAAYAIDLDGVRYGRGVNVAITTSGAGVSAYGNVVNISGAANENFGFFANISAATTNYGVYVNPTGGVTNWGVYVANGRSYFDDEIGVGATPNATYGIEVANVTYSRGIDIGMSLASGNVYGAVINMTGAATTNYGVYVDPTNATTNWAFYGANGRSYFDDEVGMGALPVATYGLELSKSTYVRGINLSLSSAAAGDKYGVIANITGGSTTSTGFYASVVGAGTNYSFYSAAGQVVFVGLTSDSTGDYVCYNTGTGAITQGTATCTLSSERYKHDFQDDVLGLEALMKVPTYSFVRNNHIELGRTVGLKAEELALIEPRLIIFDDSGRPDKFLYENYTAWLTKAIQELAVKVQRLEAR